MGHVFRGVCLPARVQRPALFQARRGHLVGPGPNRRPQTPTRRTHEALANHQLSHRVRHLNHSGQSSVFCVHLEQIRDLFKSDRFQ